MNDNTPAHLKASAHRRASVNGWNVRETPQGWQWSAYVGGNGSMGVASSKVMAQRMAKTAEVALLIERDRAQEGRHPHER